MGASCDIIVEKWLQLADGKIFIFTTRFSYKNTKKYFCIFMNEIYTGQNRHFQFQRNFKDLNFLISGLNDLCSSQKVRDLVVI